MYNEMYNENLLTDVREGNSWLFGYYNAGITSTNKNGRAGYIECWLNKEDFDHIFCNPTLEEMGFHITSHMTVYTGIKFSTPSMRRSSSTKIEWAYHTLTTKQSGYGICSNIPGEF